MQKCDSNIQLSKEPVTTVNRQPIDEFFDESETPISSTPLSDEPATTVNHQPVGDYFNQSRTPMSRIPVTVTRTINVNYQLSAEKASGACRRYPIPQVTRALGGNFYFR